MMLLQSVERLNLLDPTTLPASRHVKKEYFNDLNATKYDSVTVHKMNSIRWMAISLVKCYVTFIAHKDARVFIWYHES